MKIDTDSKKIQNILSRGVEEIIERESLIKKLKSGRRLRIKFGIDPTAPDIHLGHAVPFKKLKQFQNLGHQIVLVIGDFTAQIGDPTGRQEARKPLSKKEISENLKNYLSQINKIINVKKSEIRRNNEWFLKEGAARILELSRAGSIQQILRRADFKKRIDKGRDVSLLEALYPLFQGYDSVKIKSDLEIGGTDQKFNLIMGRKIQRRFEMPEQDIMTVPLLEGTDGVKKMSKSCGNHIAVNEKPSVMFGKIMALPDNLIIKYFLLLTDAPEKEIKKMETDMKINKLNPRDAKARLAKEIVSIYHGVPAAKKAENEFNIIFKKKELPSEMTEIVLPEKSVNILDLLTKTKLASSKSEARRLIVQKGVKIDGKIEDDWRKTVEIKKETIIQTGKRKFVKVVAMGNQLNSS